MIASNKLRGRMLEQGLTIAAVAKHIGVTPYTLGRKIRNATPMTLTEAQQICDALGIPKNEVSLYFFAPEVAKCNIKQED